MFRLLQVEDDPRDVRLLGEALLECVGDLDVRVANDGAEAVELLQRSAADPEGWLPELIVCDLNMPRMDGHAFLRAIKADPSLQHIPVIMLTSSAAPNDVALSYRLHANCYISKPGSFEELCVVARRMNQFWRETARLPVWEAA